MKTALLAASMLLACACSSQQLYDSAAGWRENECMQILDTPRRERCLKEARAAQDEYDKQRR
jgi:hypothetical protein